MKDIQKQDRSLETDTVSERPEAACKESSLQLDSSLAAALSQGVLPQMEGSRLPEMLGRLGNLHFLQLLEAAEARNGRLDRYTDRETVSPEKRIEINGRLSSGSVPEAYEIERLPQIEESLPVPAAAVRDASFLSLLAPASMEQVFSSRPEAPGALPVQSGSAGTEAGGRTS